MTGLKTLKDFVKEQGGIHPDGLEVIADLRDEAINWAKALRSGENLPMLFSAQHNRCLSQGEYFAQCESIRFWIAQFFNLSEEDLHD